MPRCLTAPLVTLSPGPHCAESGHCNRESSGSSAWASQAGAKPSRARRFIRLVAALTRLRWLLIGRV